ncbi:MAG: hypothetical protein GY795_49905 [Desulfobacterales bacterium]|nr:hypothetical protein [Desulfobacterales bacterium]
MKQLICLLLVIVTLQSCDYAENIKNRFFKNDNRKFKAFMNFDLVWKIRRHYFSCRIKRCDPYEVEKSFNT